MDEAIRNAFLKRFFEDEVNGVRRSLEEYQALFPDHGELIREEYQGVAQPATTEVGEVPAPPPEQIGPYRVLDRLGTGGMGEVYLAEQRGEITRRVAIKVIKLGMDTKQVLARFEAERQALALMNHPCIARVLEAGSTEHGRPWFAMEFVPGEPLTDYCDKHRLPIERRLEIFAELCRAAHYAHQKGLIHRDLKPTNILVEATGDRPIPKIIDFGLAKATDYALTRMTLVTEIGQVIGTPEYMSPEQAEMSPASIDIRTDIYSLGVILYELLTGELPHDSKQLRSGGPAMWQQLRHTEPPRPSARVQQLGERATRNADYRRTDTKRLISDLRTDLDWIVARAMAKDPLERYQSATELASDVTRYLRHETVLASAPSVIHRMRKFVRRHRSRVIAGAVVLLAICGGIAGIAIGMRRSAQAQSMREQLDLIIAIDTAEERQRELHPAWPEMIPKLETWLRSYREPIRQLQRGGAIPTRLERRFEETSLARQIVDVERRLRWARSIRERSVGAHRDAWDKVRAAIARSESYDGLDLEPQIGLVPVGRDPESKLFEFVHLATAASDAAVPTRDADGKLSIAADTGIVFVLLPADRFAMGAQRDRNGRNYDRQARDDEGPVHEVSLDTFFIAKHEMTQAQWQRLRGENPSLYAAGMGKKSAGIAITWLHPVEHVTWRQANDAMRELGLALPTEVQWEYAARGGTETPFWVAPREIDDAINVADRTAEEHGAPGAAPSLDVRDGFVLHAPVDAKRPNPFGLVHILGNVDEWCRDRIASYSMRARDGDGLRDNPNTALRVVRGGSFRLGLEAARVSKRKSLGPDYRNLNVGLRPTRRVVAK